MAFDHRDGAAASNPYAAVMGRTFVDQGETSALTVIDPQRAETLTAWVSRLIPGNAEWPSADTLDTVGYIDAIIRKASDLRPFILAGIDAVDNSARSTLGCPFAAAAADERDAILRDAEARLAPEAFSVILELTYEAYYRHPDVQEIAKIRTGFDVRNTVVGKPMEPFPTERLQQIGTRPDHYRSVNA